jgi:hypothetical protein
VGGNLEIIHEVLVEEPFKPGFEKINLEEALSQEKYSKTFGMMLSAYLEQYRSHYQKIYNDNVTLIEKRMAYDEKNGVNINDEKNKYHNESLADLVKNITTKNRLIEYNGKLVQQINPIFQDPKPSGILDYRTAFFLPEKNLLGMTVSTFIFDILVIWIMSLGLYIALYFEWMRKLVDSFGKVNIPKRK